MVDVHTNLLKNRKTLSEKDYQRERSLLKWSVFGLVISVILVVALVAWSVFLTSRLSGIETALLVKSNEVKDLTQASAQQVYLKSRLGLISDYLRDRERSREAMQNVFSVSIPRVHLAGVAFESDEVLNASFVASDIEALGSVIKYFEQDSGYFIQAYNKGVARAKDGNYQLSLLLTLPKGEAK